MATPGIDVKRESAARPRSARMVAAASAVAAKSPAEIWLDIYNAAKGKDSLIDLQMGGKNLEGSIDRWIERTLSKQK